MSIINQYKPAICILSSGPSSVWSEVRSGNECEKSSGFSDIYIVSLRSTTQLSKRCI